MHPLQPILIISYEMFVRCYESLSTLTFNLIVCDEGHRLKNTNIKTTAVSEAPKRQLRVYIIF